MKARRYAAGSLLALAVVGYPFLALTYSSGAPSGFSGPEQNCTACHGSFPVNSGTGAVAISAPATFTPGVPVQVTVSVTNTTPPDPSNLQGFELSTRDAAMTSARIGTYVVDGVSVQNAQGSPDYVTHTSFSNTESSWTFEWVPPVVGSPPTVTMFAAGNAANGNGVPAGDYIYATSVNLDRQGVAGEPRPDIATLQVGPITPNPVRLHAVVSVTLARTSHVSAYLVDAAGRVLRTIVDEQLGAGESLLRVTPTGLPAGTYALVLEADGERHSRRMTIVR